MVGYADVDCSMAEDRNAISGYTFLIDGVSCLCLVAGDSLIENEYVVAMHEAKEALWLHNLLSLDAMVLFSDNQGCNRADL